MSEDKIYIIDPLTSICKVALLFFMPEKTKLAINHNVIYIQGYSCYQWLERMKNGDSRIDISNLNSPFLKAIKWYIINNTEKAVMDGEVSDSVKSITKFTILGLKKLQKCTYSNDPAIKIILQYFINVLRDALENIWNEENIVKIDNNNHDLLSDKIKNNFESQTINSIAKLLNDAFALLNDSDKLRNQHENINVLIECVHNLLINRDNTFVKLMKETNIILV